MRILIVRHGQAGKADVNIHPDDDLRPLTGKGRKAFKQAAKGLRTLGMRPSGILTSPAKRTLQTAKLLAHAVDLDPGHILGAPELHHEVSPAKALEALARKRLPKSIAMVGHEPWLGRFLSLLLAGNEHVRFELDKGGACLVESASLAKGKGRLVWFMTQDQLAALA